jgi:hypothetical protein
MTAYRKQSYEDQDDGRILKAAWKQQYTMFPAPIYFLNDELKAELGLKLKKEEEEDDAKFCSLKVPMETKNQKPTYSGTPEEFLRWRLILNEQMKNHGYNANYDMVINLAQAMLAGSSLEAIFNERRAQETKKHARRRSKGVHSVTNL